MPADSFSRRIFPRLTDWCLRQKINCSADILSGLDDLVFHFGGEKRSADNLDWSISPILTVLILGEKNKPLGRQFFGA